MLAQRLGHESEDARLSTHFGDLAANHGCDMIDADETGGLEPNCELRGIGRYIDARETAGRLQLVRNQSDRKRLVLSDNRTNDRSTPGLPREGETRKTSIPVGEHPCPTAGVKDRADYMPSVRIKRRGVQIAKGLKVGG
jgi:hypothetical protein